MQSSSAWKLVVAGVLLAIFAGGVAYGDIVVFDNEAADNDWNNPANWFNFTSNTNDVFPGAADQALVNGDNLAQISANSAFSPSQVWISNASGGTIGIGADLTVNSGIIIGLSGQSTNPAIISQTGGNVVGAGFLAISGAAGNVPLSPSIYEISGGSLSSPFYSIGTVGFGTLAIVGSSPTVSSSGTVVFGPGGTLEFELDATGVSPLIAQFTNNHAASSSLVVDGSAYAGGPGIIPLVQVDATDNPFANVSVVGFGPLTATVVQNGGDVNLVLSGIPEPSSIAIAIIGALVSSTFVGSARRR